MTYSKGKFSKVSANIILNVESENPTSVTIADGDTLGSIVVAAGNYGSTEERTFENVTVLGFTMKPIDVKRGATRIYDGVPMYLGDPNGNSYRGFVQEVVEVRDVVIEVPGEEGEDPTSLRINVGAILNIEVANAEETDEEEG